MKLPEILPVLLLSLSIPCAAHDAVTDLLKDVQDIRGLIDKGDVDSAAEQTAGLKIPDLPASRLSLAYAARGGVYLRLGKIPEAEADLRAAVSADPFNFDALRSLSLLLGASGRPAEALIYADHLVASSPEDLKPADKARALVERAQLEVELAATGRAEADLKAAGKLAPDDAFTLQATEAFWRKRGLPKEGLSSADRLVKISKDASPDRARALADRALLYIDAGNYKKAEADLSAILAANPKDDGARGQMARCLSLEGRGAEALKFASGVQLGELETGLKDYAKAETALAESLKTEPGDLQALRAMRQNLVAQGRFSDAMPYADKVVALAEGKGPVEHARALVDRADIQVAVKNWNDASSDLKAALKDEPGLTEAGFLLAVVTALPMKTPRDAVAAIDAVIAASPAASAGDRARQQTARFLSLTALKDFPSAEISLRAAIKADANFVCGEPLPLVNRSELDLIFFDLCLKEFPRDAGLLTDRGIAHYLKGQKDSAIEDLSAALKQKPEGLEAALSLAAIFQETKEADRALAVIGKSISAASKRKGEPLYQEAVAMQSALAPAAAAGKN